MPARNVPRCRPRSMFELNILEELNSVHWVPLIPGSQFPSLDAMRASWERHGERILSNYIHHRPGTRPFALWALGELPLPPLKHPPLEHSLRTVIGNTTFFSQWHYFGTRTGEAEHYCAGSSWGEFEHLRQLGVISRAEAAQAAEWVDDRHYDPCRQDRAYVSLSQ